MRRTRFLGAAAASMMLVSGCTLMAQSKTARPCLGDCRIDIAITGGTSGPCTVDDLPPYQVAHGHRPVITWALPTGYVFPPKDGIEFEATGKPIFKQASGTRRTFRMLDTHANQAQESYKYTIRAQRDSGEVCTERDPTVLNDGCDPNC